MDLLESRGWQVGSWTPPEGIELRGLRSGQGEVDYWKRSTDSRLADTHLMGIEPSDCCYVGFNLGGSLAAYFSTYYPVCALIVIGSVPRLSAFWPDSMHPVAVAVRKQTKIVDPKFEHITRQLDLISSLSEAAVPTLIQCGRLDQWLEAESLRELEQIRPLNWYDDDHAMLASATRDARMHFLSSQVVV